MDVLFCVCEDQIDGGYVVECLMAAVGWEWEFVKNNVDFVTANW